MGCIINFKVLSNLGQKINKKKILKNSITSKQSVITIICLVYKNKEKKKLFVKLL